MRLWSLHPQYLDSKGLVALWREGLLAQAVLSGKTRGYRQHPQLSRFLQSPAPRAYIAAYLRLVHAEAVRRGYCFDSKKIDSDRTVEPLNVTQGQLDYEWKHLRNKLKTRAPVWFAQLKDLERPEPHPLFQVVPGNIAEWEVVTAQQDKRFSAPHERKRD